MNAFKQIRAAGVPLCAIESADPAESVRNCLAELNGHAEETPLMQWDILNGITGYPGNALGIELANRISPSPFDTASPSEALKALARPDVPRDTVIFYHNAPRYLGDPQVVQGIWNLRDKFKSEHCTLVMLGTGFQIPAELRNDVVLNREPLPDSDALLKIVESIVKDAGISGPDPEQMGNVLDTVRGLSAFGAEQILALSVRKAGIDRQMLWTKKRSMIEQTRGLSVYAGSERFADIGGCENAKSYTRDLLAGNEPPKAIVFIDEIEKALAGSAGDSSGVSQDYLLCLLTWMQDKNASGMLFVGPPGAAKSALAKAAGNEGNIPTIQLDLGGMKGSLVGQSEQTLRSALDMIEAVAQGSVLFIATCNSLAILPPELKRRFTEGTFFFDLPTPDERALIWELYLKKYSLPEQPLPQDEGWTGAEIKSCCQKAWKLRKTLLEASRFIVPVAKSAADKIDQLRREAIGRFISASYSGTYSAQTPATQPARGRTISL